MEGLTNDINLPEDTDTLSDRRNMVISYSTEQQSYTLKDLGQGSGTFVKLDNPIILQGTKMVSFGDSHMVVRIDGQVLRIKFVDGPKMHEEFAFKPTADVITIGRMPS